MGGKIKKYGLALAIMLAAIYVQQPVFEEIAEAKAVENPKTWTGKEETEGEQEGELEKDPEEEPKPGELEKEPEEQPKPVEPLQKFTLEETKPDGKNGYYLSSPSVKIIHRDSRGSTRYQFTDGEGEQKDGTVTGQSGEVSILPELFRDGINILDIWMTDDGGAVQEDQRERRTYYVDTKTPVLTVQAPRGFDVWYQNEAAISVQASDGEMGSGIHTISCYMGNKLIGSYEKEGGIFLINWSSFGGIPVEVSVYAEDVAGNLAKVGKALFIDNTPPRVWIDGFEDYMITSESVEAVFRAQDENVLDRKNAVILWENTDGGKTELAGEWRADEKSQIMNMKLNQDGIYRMEVYAADKAGFETSKSAQIIIDKSNPVISFVDQTDGQYMREFCLEYSVSDIIRDFTSYTYEIKLDGQLYTLGERRKDEGVHHLKVQAKDSAGNEAYSAARFVIDRTPPKIMLDGLKEGEAYEEEKTFKVYLTDSEDKIDQIKINGKIQKLKKGNRTYEYHMKEPGYYEIEVKASDKAGNKSEKSRLFSVAKKETALEKVLNPVKKTLGIGTEAARTTDKKQVYSGEEDEQSNRKSPVAAGIIIAVLAVSAIVYKIMKKSHFFLR